MTISIINYLITFPEHWAARPTTLFTVLRTTPVSDSRAPVPSPRPGHHGSCVSGCLPVGGEVADYRPARANCVDTPGGTLYQVLVTPVTWILGWGWVTMGHGRVCWQCQVMGTTIPSSPDSVCQSLSSLNLGKTRKMCRHLYFFINYLPNWLVFNTTIPMFPALPSLATPPPICTGCCHCQTTKNKYLIRFYILYKIVTLTFKSILVFRASWASIPDPT